MADLDEAIDYLRVSRDVAAAAGDLVHQLSHVEQIDDLLERRLALSAESPARALECADTCRRVPFALAAGRI